MAGPPRVPLHLPADPEAPVPAEDELIAAGRVLSLEMHKNADLCERVLRVRRAIRARREPTLSAGDIRPQRALLYVERDPKLIVAEVASAFYRLREPINRRKRIARARGAKLDVLEWTQAPMCQGVNNLLTTEMVKTIYAARHGIIPLPPGAEHFEFIVGCLPVISKCQLVYGVLLINPATGKDVERLVFEPQVWRAIVPDMTTEERVAFSRSIGGLR
jgi:hypothetical protein